MSKITPPAEEIKEESKGEGGSWAYGFILMAIGAFLTALGILELLNYSYVFSFLMENEQQDVAVMLSITGIMSLVIAMFAIAGGFGLIIDQEWAWGISMLVLTYSAVVSVINVIQSNMSLGVNPSDTIAMAIMVVSIAIIVVSAIGLVYLGLTKYKYA